MTAVKICGITNWEDARAASACGAAALGFIFFEGSPRAIDPDGALKIIAKLPRTLATVGVFVNQPILRIQEIYEHCRLDFIQLSGDEAPEFCNQIPESILIKAVSPKTDEDLNRLSNYRVTALLVDSREPNRYGGTGKLSNWEQASTLARKHPVILAGGLNSENVGAAITAVSPEAVDVSSGVEISPGKKDYRKMRTFVENARAIAGPENTNIFSPDRLRFDSDTRFAERIKHEKEHAG